MATAGEVKWAAGGWSVRAPARRLVCLPAQLKKNVAIESCC